jgi:radical SAM protein with 4Fe4S-binding SPASM domain
MTEKEYHTETDDGMKKFTSDGKVKMLSTEADVNQKLSSIIGEKFIEYRKKFEAASNFQLETEFPLYIQIELHQICNLKCPMCSIGHPDANQKYVSDDKMSWETYKKVILECEKYGCPSMNPQGINEPLLTPDFEKYIKFAKDHGFIDILMNTNGTLLTEERARALLDSGITRLRFSIDAATKETYEKIRIGGDFDKVVKNIERFLEIKKEGGYELPVVGVNLCKMKNNEHEVDQFIEMWKDKVDMVAIQNFIPPELQADYSEFYSSTEYTDEMEKGFSCEQPWQRIYVSNNGEVCPCCTFFNKELSLGNVADKSLYEMWNSSEMKSLRQLHKEGRYYDNPWCNSCVQIVTNKSNDELIQIRTNQKNN